MPALSRATFVLLVLLLGASAAAAKEHALPGELFHDDLSSQLLSLREAALSLPVAALLGALLAFRPRRRNASPRKPAVIQTQIVLAILGALIMIVVGASLARAFGIVGAAGLIRYRSKIGDPKDAVVMLSTLGVGLASGVGLYWLALFATLFILLVLWLVESLEPEAFNLFSLKVSTKQAAKLRPELEAILRRHRIEYELRSSSAEELCYEVKMPPAKQTNRISDAILALDPPNRAAVHWDQSKVKE
jgi:uncharacterized membrane protein YhiD involved in acid resistance